MIDSVEGRMRLNWKLSRYHLIAYQDRESLVELVQELRLGARMSEPSMRYISYIPVSYTHLTLPTKRIV